MPSTINGIGTRYYGKKNVHVRQDQCEHCGAYADIESYDTTKYFVVLFVPVLPLGGRHVIDMCGSCERHYVVSSKDWEERKQEAMKECADAFTADRYDGEKAVALLEVSAGFRDKEGFLRHAGEIESAVSSDGRRLALLASVYDLFDEPRRAEETYRKALRVQDEAGIRASLGALLVRQGRRGEAKEHLKHLLSPLHGNEVDTLYFLVEGYQAQGDHSDAKGILDEMLRAFPDLETDDTFQMYRERVGKHLGSDRRVPSPLSNGAGGAASERDWGGSTAPWVSAAILVALIASGALYVFTRTQRAEVYLVNGLDRAYDVRIGETTHHLPPGAPVEVTVPRRAAIVAEVSEPDWQEHLELPLPAGFWESLSDESTYVVNPDRLAVILWEQTEYAVNPVEKELPYRIHLGKGFYAFDGLDYVFEEFPDEIQLSSSSTVARRDRIASLEDLHPLGAYAAAGFVNPEEGLSYLIRALLAHPDDAAILGVVASMMPLEEFEKLATPELERRPLQVEWHRIYQSVMEAGGRTEELLESYGALADREPEERHLKYLLARITPDPVAAERLLREAVEEPSPSAYGFHGLAYQRLVEGSFPDAHDLALRARELDPENPLFTYVEERALLALRRFDALIERNEALVVESPFDGDAVARLVGLHAASGDLDRASAVIETFIETAGSEGEDYWNPYLQSAFVLATGDWDAFQEHAGAIDEPRFRYQEALVRGDYQGAIDALKAGEEQTAIDHLLVYLAARRANEGDLARAQLDAAIEGLSQGTPEERILAECLAGDRTPESALALALEPEAKAVGLAALSSRFGHVRSRELARKLNFDLGFRARFLDRIGF